MQPAGPAAGSSSRRQGEATVIADVENRRCKVDFDILECPICSEPFAPPVYQCENGHTACASCCKRTTEGCPSCTLPIGHIRCMFVEKMIDSLEIDCKYAHLGCTSTLRFFQKGEHENELCVHRPIKCPLPQHCQPQYEGPRSSIPTHLLTVHGAKSEEFSEATRSASFCMSIVSDEYVVLKSKDKWLLLHCTLDPKLQGGARMYCISFGRPEDVNDNRRTEAAYKLRVAPILLNMRGRALGRTLVYNMEAVAMDYSLIEDGEFDYLFIPKIAIGHSIGGFDVTVTLV